MVSSLTEEWKHGLYVLSDLENTRENELIKSLIDVETKQNKKPSNCALIQEKRTIDNFPRFDFISLFFAIRRGKTIGPHLGI